MIGLVSSGGSSAVGDILICNGVNAASGTYLLPDLPSTLVPRLALGEHLDAAYLDPPIPD